MKLLKKFTVIGKRKRSFRFTITIHGVENLPNDSSPVYCRCVRGNRTHNTKVAVPVGKRVLWRNEQFNFVGTLYETKSNSFAKKMMMFKIRSQKEGEIILNGNLDLADYAANPRELHVILVNMREKRRKKNLKSSVTLKISIHCQEDSTTNPENSDSDSRSVSNLSGRSEDVSPSRSGRRSRSKKRESYKGGSLQIPQMEESPLSVMRTDLKISSTHMKRRFVSEGGVGRHRNHNKSEILTLSPSLRKEHLKPRSRAKSELIASRSSQSFDTGSRHNFQVGLTVPTPQPRHNTSPADRPNLNPDLFLSQDLRDIDPCRGEKRTNRSPFTGNSLDHQGIPFDGLAIGSLRDRDSDEGQRNQIFRDSSGDIRGQEPLADLNHLFGGETKQATPTEQKLDDILCRDHIDLHLQESNSPLSDEAYGFRREKSNPSTVTSEKESSIVSNSKIVVAQKAQAKNNNSWDKGEPVNPKEDAFQVSRRHYGSPPFQGSGQISRGGSTMSRDSEDPLQTLPVASSKPSGNGSVTSKRDNVESEGRRKMGNQMSRKISPPQPTPTQNKDPNGKEGDTNNIQSRDSNTSKPKPWDPTQESQREVKYLCEKVIPASLSAYNESLELTGNDSKLPDSVWFWNTIAVMPCIIVRCLMHWGENTRIWAAKKVAQTFERIVKQRIKSDETKNIGTLSNIGFLIHLLCRYGEDCKGVENILFPSLIKLGRCLFVDMTQYFVKMIPDLKAEVILNAEEFQSPIVEVFLARCQAIMGMLSVQYVSPSLQCQILQRLLRAFVCKVVNGLLVDEDAKLCDANSGFGLKVVTANITAWCEEHAPKSELMSNANRELDILREICDILLLGKGVRSRAIRALNQSQLQTLANRYNYNVAIKDRIDEKDINDIVHNGLSSIGVPSGPQHVRVGLELAPEDVVFDESAANFELSVVPISPQILRELEFLNLLSNSRR
ncbi:hypothetical protein AAMO2058_001034000 [Amorphochlora amoebiformis]